MLANWVKENTTTTGTGTITLGGAVTGFSPVSAAFADKSNVVYTIEDGNNREWGIGIFTASGGTLARTKVIETLVSGTRDNTSPTPITLSGSATVSISAGPTTQAPVTTWFYDSNYMDYADNLSGENGGAPGSNSDTVTANRCTYCAFLLERPRLITNLSIIVGTASGGATVSKVGMFTCTHDGKPGTLIESVTIDVTTTGVKSAALSSPRLFNAGWYYSAFATDGTPAIGSTKLNSIAAAPTGLNTSVPRIYTPYETLAGWSDLPATATPIMGNNYAPVVFFT